jgi:hypothetical protein
MLSFEPWPQTFFFLTYFLDRVSCSFAWTSLGPRSSYLCLPCGWYERCAPPRLACWLRWSFTNFSPRLALNLEPPDRTFWVARIIDVSFHAWISSLLSGSLFNFCYPRTVVSHCEHLFTRSPCDTNATTSPPSVPFPSSSPFMSTDPQHPDSRLSRSFRAMCTALRKGLRKKCNSFSSKWRYKNHISMFYHLIGTLYFMVMEHMYHPISLWHPVSSSGFYNFDEDLSKEYFSVCTSTALVLNISFWGALEQRTEKLDHPQEGPAPP